MNPPVWMRIPRTLFCVMIRLIAVTLPLVGTRQHSSTRHRKTTFASFSPALALAAPNSTYNVGADISLTPKVVATTRFGYFFENYHDFGWPTTARNLVWSSNGAPTNPGTPQEVDVCDNSNVAPSSKCPTGGNPLPAGLTLAGGTTTTPYLGSFTKFNANKHYQFDQDVAFFKGGWWGTHNLK